MSLARRRDLTFEVCEQRHMSCWISGSCKPKVRNSIGKSAARVSGLAFGLALAVRPGQCAAFRPGICDFRPVIVQGADVMDRIFPGGPTADA